MSNTSCTIRRMSLHSDRPSWRPSGTCQSLGTLQCATMWYDGLSYGMHMLVFVSVQACSSDTFRCGPAKREASACSGARGQAPTRSPGSDARLRPLRQPPRGRRVDDRSSRLQPAKQCCVSPDLTRNNGRRCEGRPRVVDREVPASGRGSVRPRRPHRHLRAIRLNQFPRPLQHLFSIARPMAQRKARALPSHGDLHLGLYRFSLFRGGRR